LEVTKEIAARYYKIRKEQPELTDMEAYDMAAEIKKMQ
jgi:cytochrome c